MQFKALALSALAAVASAQSSASTSVAAPASGTLNQASVLSVLLTALPSSLLAEAITNSRAVYSEVASEFAAGSTPAWFTALPTPIQSYLTAGSASGVASNASGIISSLVPQNSSIALNSTLHSKTHTVKVTHRPVHHTTGQQHQTSAQNTESSSASAAASSSSSSGMASLPSAVVGAGLAGAVGIVGLFAL